MYADRLPPHDAQAEESVIGSVLIDGDSLHKISSLIKPTDFYGEKNRWCYEAFLGLAERGEAINQVTVSHELALQERLDSLGGSAYLSHLVMVVPTSVHIEYYAGIVQRTSVMRQLIDAGGRIADIGYHESDSDTDRALASAENLLFQIRSRRGQARSCTSVTFSTPTWRRTSRSPRLRWDCRRCRPASVASTNYLVTACSDRT